MVYLAPLILVVFAPADFEHFGLVKAAGSELVQLVGGDLGLS
jgi:hypothetical protein